MSDFETLWDNAAYENQCTHIKINEYVKSETKKICLHYLSDMTLVQIVINVLDSLVGNFAYVEIVYSTRKKMHKCLRIKIDYKKQKKTPSEIQYY